MSKIAKPRWKMKRYVPKTGRWFWVKPGYWLFELEDGEEFRVLDLGTPRVGLIISSLPIEYLELGDFNADQMNEHLGDLRQAKAYVEDVIAENQMLRQRIDAAPETERIVPILCADLEKAINMMMRFAQSLGIMDQGPLYDEIQVLASKYGMEYRSPELVQREDPLDYLGADKMIVQFDPGTGRLIFTPGPNATIEGTTTDKQRALPPGEWIIDDDGDPS